MGSSQRGGITKYVKQKKKLPVSATQVVKLVRLHGGQDVAAKQFLSENEDFLSSDEKFNLLTDFDFGEETRNQYALGTNPVDVYVNQFYR